MGDVDEDGCKAVGSAATGFPEWIMTKVMSSVELDVVNSTNDTSHPQWTT